VQLVGDQWQVLIAIFAGVGFLVALTAAALVVLIGHQG